MKRTSKPNAAEAAQQKKRAEAEARRARLITEARKNPQGFFSYEETGIILGFAQDCMTELAGMGAPVIFRSMNPAMICQWIGVNQETIGKLSEAREKRKQAEKQAEREGKNAARQKV